MGGWSSVRSSSVHTDDEHEAAFMFDITLSVLNLYAYLTSDTFVAMKEMAEREAKLTVLLTVVLIITGG